MKIKWLNVLWTTVVAVLLGHFVFTRTTVPWQTSFLYNVITGFAAGVVFELTFPPVRKFVQEKWRAR